MRRHLRIKLPGSFRYILTVCINIFRQEKELIRFGDLELISEVTARLELPIQALFELSP